MNWFLENWQAIVGTGTVTTIINYIVNKKQQNQLLKKGEIEVQKDQIDLAKNTREFLLLKEADFKTEREEYRKELETIKNEAKSERQYYREKVNGLRNSIDNLQNKFDQISINYALEVEKSDSWMKKYFEIEKENQQLKEQISKVEKRCKDLEVHIKKLEKELIEHKNLSK
jgi:chromosome segregation ATPase